MKLKEENDCHHNDDIEYDSSSYYDNRKDLSKISCVELRYESRYANDKDKCINESEKNCVEKHKQEKFTIMETDTSINPRTKSLNYYQ